MVVLAIALSSGILFAAIFIAKWIAFIVAITIAVALFLLAGVCVLRKWYKVALCLVVFVLGFASFTLDYHLTNPRDLAVPACYVEGRIDQIGADKDVGSVFYLEDVKIDGQTHKGRVQLVSSDYVRPSVGQYFCGDVELEAILLAPFDTVAMSFDRYNVRYQGEVTGEYRIIVHGKLKLSEKVRERIGSAMDSIFNRDQRGVAESLLFGDRAYLDAEDYQEIKTSGLAHIFSVSGLHVGFLVVVLMWIFKKLRINQLVSFVIVIASLFAYQVLCGYAPTIMRSIVMTAIVMLAKLTHQRVDSASSLATAVIVLELINPSTLFDIGFLMSVGSIAGIILFATPIYRALNSKIKLDKLSLSVGTSIGANAGLFPIMTNVFGTFNPYFILANFIVLPMVTVLFVLLIIGAFAGAIAPALAVLLYPSKYLIIALLAMAKIIASLPYADLPIASMGLVAIFYYAFLIVLSRYTMLDKKTKLKLTIILLLLTAITAILLIFV